MARLRLGDLSRLLAFVGDCYGVRDRDVFGHHLVHAIAKLIPSDITTYNEVDPRRRTIRWVWHPEADAPPPALTGAFAEHMSEHPLIRAEERHRNGRPRKISDFLSRAAFHDLGIYTEFFRHFDVEHQMAVGIPARPPLVIGIALNRSVADFSEGERQLLDLVRPHLAQSYRNALAVTVLRQGIRLGECAVEASGGALIVVSRAGQVIRMTPNAAKWLGPYFADRPTGVRLPDPLVRWVRQHHAVANGEVAIARVREPLVVAKDSARLVIQHLCDRDQCLLLLREQPAMLEPVTLGALGLTRREAEVLAWLAQGKTNPEIALILGARPKTVSKHLERIYRKLRVETRTAAAATALQAAAVRA